MRISPENLVKVTIMAVVGLAILRLIAGRLGIPGLSALIG